VGGGSAEEGGVGGVPEPALGDEGGGDEGGGEAEAKQDLAEEDVVEHHGDRRRGCLRRGAVGSSLSVLASIEADPQRWRKRPRICPEFGERRR
jgi:hypothetical protein